MPIKHDDALDATMSAMRFLLYVRNDDGTYNKPQEIKGSITIDVYDLPDDFESQVQKAFGEFTEGTAKDYTLLRK